MDNSALSTTPVALIIQTRVSDEGAPAYAAWQTNVGQLLAQRKGFLGQQVVAPTPPAQVDWIVIQRFASLEDARSWMQSDTLHDSLSRIRDYFVGNDDMYLRSEAPSKTDPVTALISCKVAPELEEGFQQWEMEAFRVEANAPGFIGHRLQRPVPGVQDDWIIELTFDSNSSLDRWLSSSERAALLKSGQEYQGDVRVRRGTYGFEFWARDASQPAPSTLWIFKSNLLALLVLYPTVYLWGYLISHPFIDTKGAPVWLSLFLGNAFSTQFLGFIAVPWIFKVFDFWLNGKLGEDKEPVGWLLILVLYALSMAGFAFILKLPPLSFG